MLTKEIQIAVNKGTMLPLMEEFYTIQGEGFHTGTAAYFIRIGGCDVGCHWCDVKESWNAELHPPTAIDKIVENAVKYADTVVVTGGEPLMWDMNALTHKLKEYNQKHISKPLAHTRFQVIGIGYAFHLKKQNCQRPCEAVTFALNCCKVLIKARQNTVQASRLHHVKCVCAQLKRFVAGQTRELT